jgi:hypothetical protein
MVITSTIAPLSAYKEAPVTTLVWWQNWTQTLSR